LKVLLINIYIESVIVRVNMKLNCLDTKIPFLNVMLIYEWQILLESTENVSSSEEFSFR